MRKCLLLILCILLIGAVFFIWFFRPKTVDWNMTAHMFTQDGTAESSFPITIAGRIQDDRDNEKLAYLYLSIDFPDDFRYTIPSSDDANPGYKGTEFKDGNPDNLRTSDVFYNKETNTIGSLRYVINAELGYFLAYWPDDGSYLVAATDPDVTVSEVIAHFQPYCDELWGISNGE